MRSLSVTQFADPSCPWDFAAEPIRQRLRWRYGDQLRWQMRMIVLYEDVESQVRRGRSPERISAGLVWFQKRFGMPMDVSPRSRLAASEPACRAVVAARLHAPEKEETLLRQLRVLGMGGGILDDPDLIDAAAASAGIDPGELAAWSARDDVEKALRDDVAASRAPRLSALALDDKLGGPTDARRYTAPSYLFERPDDDGSFVLPGFHSVDACEAAIANLAPELVRRPKPETVDELLYWAGIPLATAEIALVMELEWDETRRRLARVADAIPSGSEFYWTLRP